MKRRKIMGDAKTDLNDHLREVIGWHFSEETGTPFWLNWAKSASFSPVDAIQTVDDLMLFEPFEKATLRDAPHEEWIPRALSGEPFKVFETSGTTGMPTQRLSWKDHETDYAQFSKSLSDTHFPKGANWLIVGPTGPRRLRVTMEYMANLRGGVAYHVDLDPRWVRRCLAEGKADLAMAYRNHVIAQAIPLIQNRDIQCIFITPNLLEALSEVLSLSHHGIRGVLVGGTSISPQTARFLQEEVLKDGVAFTPVYGNTLMGVAPSAPVSADNGYEVVYYAPQPRAILRVVDDGGKEVDYGERGRIELTTLTRELFLPRLLERDEAIRRPPTDTWPWDGVGDVRPLEAKEGKTIEGVY
jgi:phenylacetate-coenzyme A ligase PaaK-like adenylate-forming protein